MDPNSYLKKNLEVLARTGHFPGLAAQIIVGNISELVYLYGELIQAEFDMVLQHIFCHLQAQSN